MTLIKTSLLSSIAVIIKMLTLLGLNKILAIYIGPTGYAALGQFQNAVQMITAFASGAISTGVTKYTAEFHADEVSQHKIWRTSGTVALVLSLITALLVLVFNRSLAGWFLKDEAMGAVFIWFSATLVLFVFNTLLLAILNGKKEVKQYVLANIAGSIFALVVSSVMAVNFGLYGALIALAVHQSLTFFVTLLLTYRAPWFQFRYLFGPVDRGSAKKLAKYAAMAIVSAVCMPISHILVRNHLGETLGWNAAGYWEAMWRLSSAYLMLVTTTLSVYYLPRLAEINSLLEVKREIVQGYKIILPIAILCCLVVYTVKEFIILALFSSEFLPMVELFAWQLVGDVLKIFGWLLSYVLLGRSFISFLVCGEIFFAFFFYCLVVVFSGWAGLEGASIAHAVNYLVYSLVLLYYVAYKVLNINSAA